MRGMRGMRGRHTMLSRLAAASGFAVLLGLAVPGNAAAAAVVHGANAGPPAKASPSPSRTLPPVRGVSTRPQPVRRACPPPKRPGLTACLSFVRTNIAGHKGLFAADTTPAGYGPADLQSAYNLPSATAGSGQTVAVVDAFDDPNAEADLATYRQQYGLPPCTTANGCFEKVNQDGQQGNYPATDPTGGWEQEESLDVDMVSALCPACHILLVEANDASIQNLGAAVNEAVALGAKYVSNSYGGSEDPSDPTLDSQDFDHPGVAVTASSGDAGYGTLYPAASQYVTAVGGTTLTQDSSSPRGWDETAWAGAGSGCSSYDAKPWWQTDTGCLNRTITDVSAEADPDTGVAVYDSYNSGGWGVVGGTSVASPIIASTYALAGPPVAGTYPASYPYAHASALNDVTTGSNGSCDPAYLCTAGPGYDGPTGLGTPDGTGAFALGAHGVVTGTVVSARTHKPLAGAEVDVGAAVTRTGAGGSYSAVVQAGSYDVTARTSGYASSTISGVTVTDGQAVTENFALDPVSSVPVTGTVTDGSGHGWALYAKVRVLDPAASTYTDPVTGRYRLMLTADNTYRIAVTPVSPGYQPVIETVRVGGSGAIENIKVPVDSLACDAPGYAFSYTGSTETFDATTVPPGWTVINNGGTTKGWEFDNPGGLGNQTGGSGGYAVAAAGYPNGMAMDSSLETPVVDMTGDQSPIIQFDTDLPSFPGRVADVDLSTDGGSTWTTVWQQLGLTAHPTEGQQIVALPQAAGQSQVQVRFHYVDPGNSHWELDNVFLGNRACTPTPGGLVAGTVSDGNTGQGIDGATVSGSGVSAVTAAMPDDPALAHGFYSLFTTQTGSQTFNAARGAYVTQSKPVDVTPDAVTAADFTLQAGRLQISPQSVSASVPLGHYARRRVTLTDTGRAPVTVSLGEEAGDFAAAPHAGTPKAPAPGPSGSERQVRGHFSPLPRPGRPVAPPHAASPAATAHPAGPAATAHPAGPAATAHPAGPAPAGTSWAPVTNYPLPVTGSGVATDTGTGVVYSAGGFNGFGSMNVGYAYQPGSGQWTQIASMSNPRENPAAALIGGKIYVTGGWNVERFSPTVTVGQTEVYDPAADTWSAAASAPDAYAASGVAVLNGRMYVIGGCDATNCGHTDVQVYDPQANTWTTAAPYPEPIAWESCGAVTGKIYCAGGVTDNTTSTRDAFSYDPATNTWSKIASLPIDLWGSGYTAANGQLLVSGGVTNGTSTLTSQGYSYDPLADSWSALPDAGYAAYGGGSGCGFYRIGGNAGGFPTATAEQLPGYDQCGPVDVPWLSESATQFTLRPGQSITLAVTLDAADPSVSAPGTYTAALDVGNNTPYQVPGVAVTMTVRGP